MTTKDYNLALISRFPELTEVYHDEVDWSDGDETGCHIVYGLVEPFMEKLIAENDMKRLKEVFDFLEELLQGEDIYFAEVVSCSVLEGYADVGDKPALFIPMMGTKTRKLLQELLDYREKMRQQEGASVLR